MARHGFQGLDFLSTSFLGDVKLELLRSTSNKYCLAWNIAIQADGKPRRVGGFRGWIVGGFRESAGGFRGWVCTPQVCHYFVFNLGTIICK